MTSLDFSDTYFDIPISPNSRKFLRFHYQDQTFQFRALPFGLSTAPMEFTIVVKEVKLMDQARNIRMHQYLDDWLIRARDKNTCFQDTQTLLDLCQELGWVVNLKKSELEPKQIFNFVGYQYSLVQGVVRPTPERWETLNSKINSLLERTSCSVQQLMSLIGLLTATEKQVPSGRLHMRPIQWHLKNHWHIPESLEKVIPIPRSLHPHLHWWLKEENVLPGQHLHPLLSRGSDLYRRSKRRLGHTFRRLYRKRRLVRAGKQTTHQFPRIESGFIGPKGIRTSLPGLGSFSCHRQYYCGSLHKQRRRHAFRISVCSPVETPVLVQSQRNLPESTSHSGPAQCDSRQTVPTPSSHSNGMVSSPRCLCSDLPQMASSQGGRGTIATRYNCKLPQFVFPVPDPKA